jgi:hypothetical protein
MPPTALITDAGVLDGNDNAVALEWTVWPR